MFGIIGGLGPKATAEFYSMLTDRVSARSAGRPPHLLIYSLSTTPKMQNAFLQGNVAADAPARIKVRGLIDKVITCFLHNDTKIVVMPCNTLQDELASICEARKIAHINMIDETAKAVLSANIKRLFVLGTTSTCRDDLYGQRLQQHGVTCIYPKETDQDLIKTYIRHALDQKQNDALKSAFSQMVIDSVQGCDGILIACTDLTGDVSATWCQLPVFDSLQLLANASADYILTQKQLFTWDDE